MASNVPDFEEYRKEKQQQADQDFIELLELYTGWLKHHTNLREKVRAKHLFAELTNRAVEDLEEQPWKRYFEDWFAFDYITIIGTRLFDMFVKEKADVLSPEKIQMSGLVMTAALEPFQILKQEDQGALVTPLLREDEKRLTSLFETSRNVGETSYILARTIHCGFENRIFSPIVPLVLPEQNDFIDQWKTLSKAKEAEQQRLRFMKENGASWLAFAATRS
ncbi:hypothetical protein D7Z54_12885 [Salibacterium salarium]|uniref:Uncharacterized protein n=1 Tax=Salibacterium salarium TaxID=284579 RepID=A0A3R9QKP0_9BACI|nr:hypothetical protein [Salibacterium salarium]RSL32916.1 hypothetical protein D7Z54_12885 [Salibacterium salarium]